MINVTTVRNNTQAKGECYCFSSVPDETAGREEIVAQMRQYHSTLTEADANAAFAVLDETVRRLLQQGCKVKLPWVTLYFSARGTAETGSAAFVPGKGDNTFALKASPNRALEKALSRDVAFKSRADGVVLVPAISAVYAITQNAEESSDLAVRNGGVMRIRGKNLAFDVADAAQGVFFVRAQTEKTSALRASSFTRLTKRVVDVVVPRGLESGAYHVEVVTKEKTRGHMTARARETVTVL